MTARYQVYYVNKTTRVIFDQINDCSAYNWTEQGRPISLYIQCSTRGGYPPFYYKFSTERVGEKSLKIIGQYLAKIWAKICGSFFGHPVYKFKVACV